MARRKKCSLGKLQPHHIAMLRALTVPQRCRDLALKLKKPMSRVASWLERAKRFGFIEVAGQDQGTFFALTPYAIRNL